MSTITRRQWLMLFLVFWETSTLCVLACNPALQHGNLFFSASTLSARAKQALIRNLASGLDLPRFINAHTVGLSNIPLAVLVSFPSYMAFRGSKTPPPPLYTSS
jgi:hypothetical protein